MSIGLVGRKCGMTRVFTDAGETVPVTVIEALPNRITQVKGADSDGYRALQVTVGNRRQSLLNKPAAGHFAKANVAAGKGLWEMRLSEKEGVDLKAGAELKVDQFKVGQIVDVTGTTIGKGFAGVMKRHNFAGGYASHGNSLSHRAPGSIGQRQTPGRVFPGKRMSGHMGVRRRTVENLQVVQIDVERNLLLIQWRRAGRRGRQRLRQALGQGSRTGAQGSSCASQECAGQEVEMPMKLKLVNGSAGSSEVQVSDATFGREFNEALVHQVVTAYLAGGRAGTKAQKTRAEVRGGGKKPWAQKGTGQARVGSIRSPLWVGGGRAFAARPRDFRQKLNRKMYRGAMRSMLSELVRQERLVVTPSLELDAPKTKLLVQKLKDLALPNVLIVIEAFDERLHLAARNLHGVDVVPAAAVDPVSLARHEKVLVTVGALKMLEERLA